VLVYWGGTWKFVLRSEFSFLLPKKRGRGGKSRGVDIRNCLNYVAMTARFSQWAKTKWWRGRRAQGSSYCFYSSF